MNQRAALRLDLEREHSTTRDRMYYWPTAGRDRYPSSSGTEPAVSRVLTSTGRPEWLLAALTCAHVPGRQSYHDHSDRHQPHEPRRKRPTRLTRRHRTAREIMGRILSYPRV